MQTTPEVHTRLFMWRSRAGYTQQELARLSGLSAAHLSRAERGQRPLSPSAKVRLARAVGVSVSELRA